MSNTLPSSPAVKKLDGGWQTLSRVDRQQTIPRKDEQRGSETTSQSPQMPRDRRSGAGRGRAEIIYSQHDDRDIKVRERPKRHA
jgi:hypothetical protein